MGNCTYCGKRAGFLRSKHQECAEAYKTGWREMVARARNAANTVDFNEAALHAELAAIAERSWAGKDDVHAAIVQGWREGVKASLSDGILTRAEEDRLRDFRDRLALDDAQERSVTAALDRAARDRLVLSARMAALAIDNANASLNDLATAFAESNLGPEEQRKALIQGWEAAVEGALEDGVPSMDEEAALVRYLERFELERRDVDTNGTHRNLVEAAVIREATEGIIPQRFSTTSPLPMNFQKSEQLVWAFAGVDYSEVRTRRERRGVSHGVSIRIARGLYYSPRTFRSQPYEYEETVNADNGLLALTNKHVYFHGGRKSFRIRYDKVVSFEQFRDGFGLVRDAQSAKPQIFRTGDGWFVYNLVTNLARR